MIQTKPDGYLTVQEFTQRCGHTLRNVRRWIAAGKVATVKDDYAKRLLIPVSELERVQTQGVADARKKQAE